MVLEIVNFQFMRVFFLLILLALHPFAADFERSNLRSQVYAGITPYAMVDFFPAQRAPLLDKQVFPLHAGVLWSPLFTPAFKLDVPLTIWLGFDAGNFHWTELYDHTNIDSIDLVDANGNPRAAVPRNLSLSYSQWMPAATLGLSLNLFGRFDLRAMGGYGLTRASFDYKKTATASDVLTVTAPNYFAAGALEYVLKPNLFRDTDLKVGVFVRKDFLDMKEAQAVATSSDDFGTAYLNGLTFTKVEQSNLKIGLEFSIEFGRESRKERKERFRLKSRDEELRKHNQGGDTLAEWDCMAIERDYKFYLLEDGKLPDVTEQFTKSQYLDVLENFLAFCRPENVQTKSSLYASLDSNKVALKTYQVSQEESRFKQVMAANDPSYLKMFLQYYPTSRFKKQVEAKLSVLDDYSSFKRARSANSFKEYLAYLNDFPTGSYRKDAETGIWNLVKHANRQKDYEIYLKRFPQGIFVNEARRALNAILKGN